eukprot:gene10576-7346_t
MLANRVLTEEQTVIRRQFVDFFESERFEARYHRRVQKMMAAGAARLLMDMGDLLDYTPVTAGEDAGEGPISLGAGILQNPGKYIPLLELALHDMVLRLQPQYLKVDYRSRAVHVAFDGPVGQIRSPRELYARHLNTMVALEGIVTRQSANRPRVLETVHYCPATNRFTKKEFRDQLTPMLDSSHLPTVNVMPKTDMEGNPLRTELGLSIFVDSQCAILQEAPERAPTGQLPRHVELRFDDDLVDRVKPGDRVVVVGVFMPYTGSDQKSFQSIVLVNHVVSSSTPTVIASSGAGRPAGEAALTRPVSAMENHLMAFARKMTQLYGPSGVLKMLSRSIAPTIYGMPNEKAAVLLLMVGGVERLAHHSHVRGDINVLLVGEPSTAKSQLLRFVMSVSPLALSTTGKGSSGVGLTAAVAVDSYTGERSLSAGAMVLADRGILCIDEFDKMSPQDRVAMHEAMEQQTVTIAKAGIHASLNARCSVLAAANPIYGFYSVQHRLAFNVGLPESLLSRFDLTFIVLDQHSAEFNRRIGTHILRNHMSSQPVGHDPVVVRTVVGKEGREAQTSSSALGHASNNGNSNNTVDAVPDSFAMTTNSTGESIPSVSFLRAYIQLAKQGTPLLTEHSQQLVSDNYVQLRAEQQEDGGRDGFFVTARTLEAIVRLSTAHAKLRLSPLVEKEDVDVAMQLLRASVHAATAATEQRDTDNQSAAEEAMQRQAAPGVVPVTSSGTSAVQGGRGGAELSTGRKRQRDDLEGGAVTSAPSGGGHRLLSRHVMDVLKLFQREQRGSVEMEEVRRRLVAGGQLMGREDTLAEERATLRSALASMQGDAFIFESVDEGGDDTVQFL